MESAIPYSGRFRLSEDYIRARRRDEDEWAELAAGIVLFAFKDYVEALYKLIILADSANRTPHETMKNEIEVFFRTVLFNYLVCNGDAHAKNFSLRNSVENLDVYDLTPAYDLLNTSLHIPHEQSRTALDLFKDEDDFKTPFYEANGFYGAPDFLEFAKRIGVVEKRAMRFIKQAIDAVPAMEEMLDKSFLSEQGKKKYKESIRDRAKALGL